MLTQVLRTCKRASQTVCSSFIKLRTVGIGLAIFFALVVTVLPAGVVSANVTVNAPTLNGTATVTVAPNATIAVQVSVTTNQSEDWDSTSYRIGSSGNYTCVDHSDFTNSGTNSISFNILAPSSAGTSNLEIRAHGSQFGGPNNNCSTSFGGTIGTKTVTNAITVATDTTSPSVTINQAAGQADPTSTSPINFTVVFSEPVSNFVTGDVTLSGTAGATTATVTGSGTTYNVAVSGMTTSGSVIASIGAGKATDAAGNLNTASTATDNSVTYSAPVVCPAYTPVANNLITTNPSFEDTPEGTGWSTDAFPPTTIAEFSITTGHSGTGCKGAQVSFSTYTAGSDAKWTHAAVPVTAGQNYTFSNWYKADVETSLFLYYVPTGGNPNAPVVEFLSPVPASASWTQNSKSFLAAQTGTLVVAQVLQSAGTLTTDDYALVTSAPSTFSDGIISLTFDDGWTSTYESIMDANVLGNYKSTQYIYSDGMQQVHGSTFVNSTQVKALFDAGHEIGGHSKSHSNLTSTGVNLTTEVQNNKTDLEGVVGAGNVTTFAYPFGAYNSAAIDAVQNAGYVGARSVEQNYNTSATDKYLLKIQRVGSETTIDEVKAWIDTAIAQKTWLILMFHEVVPNSAVGGDCQGYTPGEPGECTSRALVQEMTNYLGSKTACVLTVAQVLANTPCSQTPPPPTDTIAPVITLPVSPLNIVATSSTSTVAAATFSATATDTNPASPVVTCTPASGSLFPVGNTTVTCVATDNANNTATSTFVVNVTTPAPANNAPVATAQSVSLDKNTSKSITLSGTDADTGATLVYATTSNPAHGTLSGTGASLTYTPASDYIGSDSFTFTVGDGLATSSSATVTITVNDVAPAPAPAPTSSGGGGGGSGGGGGLVLGLIGQVTQNGGLVLGASTQVLTDQQINAILDLLRSFNADQSVIDNVNKALRGQSTGATSGFVFSKTLQQGSTGSEVTELQKVLAALGFYSGPVTGYFGPLTKAAVIKFQAAKGLAQVGIVGPQTRAALNAR